MKKIKFKLFKGNKEITGADRLRSMSYKMEEVKKLNIKIQIVKE